MDLSSFIDLYITANDLLLDHRLQSQSLEWRPRLKSNNYDETSLPARELSSWLFLHPFQPIM